MPHSESGRQLPHVPEQSCAHNFTHAIVHVIDFREGNASQDDGLAQCRARLRGRAITDVTRVPCPCTCRPAARLAP